MWCIALAQNQGPQHPHGPGARPKEPLSKKVKTADASGADKQMATEQADEGIEVYSRLINYKVILVQCTCSTVMNYS